MNTKLKKILLQYGYLSLEKKEVFDACSSVEVEINEYMEKYYPEQNKIRLNKNPEPPKVTKDIPENDETDIEINKEVKNKDIKKLYRKIASKIHPDICSDEEQAKMFPEVIVAYEENNLAKIVEVAGIVDIEVPKLSDESMEIIQNNILLISKEIDKKKGTVAWAWFRAKDENEKMMILNKLAAILGEQHVTD